MLDISVYTSDLSKSWDTFVEKEARNATFLHTRKFLSHNPLNSRDDSSLVFRKGPTIYCVLPAALIDIDGVRIFYSHPRSTYGGFVVSNACGVSEAVQMVEMTIAHAKSGGASEIIIRNPFRIFYGVPTDETDYAMWFHGFTLKSRGLEVAIPLEGKDPDSILETFSPTTRNKTRKALKAGIIVRDSDEIELFWAILERNLRLKHNVSPVHSLDEFRTLLACVGPNKVRLFGAYKGDRLIAGIVVLINNSHAIHAQYTAGDMDYLDLCPINALVYYVSRWAIQQGFKYFNLGSANEKEGRVINWGLFTFKEGFGGHGILRETMHLVL